MNLGNYKISKIQIAVMTILLAGIITAVILVQRQQIFKSKASNEGFSSFEVKNANGNPLPYTDNPGVRTYQTDDLNVNITVKDLNGLIE